MNLDTLSDVLRGVRLRGAVFFEMSGHSDWVAEAPAAKDIASMLMPGVEHVMEYHVVAHGACWAGIPGERPVELHAGDIVMFPHGDSHVVSSAPGMRGSSAIDFIADACRRALPVQMTLGPSSGRSADTTVICGFLGCDLRPFNPLIAALPRTLHLKATKDDAWISQFTQQAVAESHAMRPGSQAMLARMSEIMFVDAVRRFADALPDEGAGWLAGLRDRSVGRALTLMHEAPGREWSTEELSRRVGLSRSSLHERFVQLIGVPPGQYLLQWRMQAAARMLLETRAPIAAVAIEVGYDSEAAFTRAFKRLVGKPPAAWRRERERTQALPSPGALVSVA